MYMCTHIHTHMHVHTHNRKRRDWRLQDSIKTRVFILRFELVFHKEGLFFFSLFSFSFFIWLSTLPYYYWLSKLPDTPYRLIQELFSVLIRWFLSVFTVQKPIISIFWLNYRGRNFSEKPRVKTYLCLNSNL